MSMHYHVKHKNYQSLWKFDKVMTKVVLLVFIGTWCIYQSAVCRKAIVILFHIVIISSVISVLSNYQCFDAVLGWQQYSCSDSS